MSKIGPTTPAETNPATISTAPGHATTRVNSEQCHCGMPDGGSCRLDVSDFFLSTAEALPPIANRTVLPGVGGGLIQCLSAEMTAAKGPSATRAVTAAAVAVSSGVFVVQREDQLQQHRQQSIEHSQPQPLRSKPKWIAQCTAAVGTAWCAASKGHDRQSSVARLPSEEKAAMGCTHKPDQQLPKLAVSQHHPCVGFDLGHHILRLLLRRRRTPGSRYGNVVC